MNNLPWKYNNSLYKKTKLNEDNSSHNYKRAFGSFGDSLTYSQSVVIKMGYKLEKILLEEVKSKGSIIILEDLLTKEKFNSLPSGAYYCTKKAIRNSDYCIPHTEPDITFIDKRDKTNANFTFIELKLGVNFDTKKSAKEKEKLEANQNLIISLGMNSNFYFCSFFGEDLNSVYDGSRISIPRDNLMLGTELCDLMGIDYSTVESKITQDIENNQIEFLNRFTSDAESLDILLIYLLKNPEIKKKIENWL